ncbi:MAG: DUF2779 domain-containing protein [Xanthomonadaceae bacterium]|nr:DUF2779 domain-containing protein [Xanthomonadaceae bacterium]
MAGLQCHRRLWLETFRHEVAKVDANAEARLATGHEIGDLARELLGPGILIGHVNELDAALARTGHLIAARPDATLFEAAFRQEGVLVRTDVLRPVDGGYDLIEVKASTQVKDYQLDDCAVQAWVITRAGVPLRRVCIAHVNNSFVYQGEGDYRGLLLTEDQTDAVRSRMHNVPDRIDSLKEVLQNPEPGIHTGEQCHKPFDCPFFDYCRAQEPAGPEYPVTILPRARKLAAQLQAEGYDDLLRVPPSRLTNAVHRRIQKATISQQPFLDGRVRAALRGLQYPRFYLDFETVDFAVPRWAGTRPYQQITFQWSCHVETHGEPLMHHSFLDLSGAAPMRPFAESLLEELGGAGPILVYNASFERTRIQELAAMFPDISAPLAALVPRIVDLLPITREHYYHPAMKGSWSIKKVLPSIAPELDYSNLDGVAASDDAPRAYLEATSPETSAARKAEINAALVRYCERDTLAMVRIVMLLNGA